MILVLPLRTISGANAREHWAVKAKRVRNERIVTARLWPLKWRRKDWDWPIVVWLTRRAPSGGLDDDNLRVALKAIRDQVAHELGLKSDRDPRVAWQYGQERGPYAVVVGIQEAA